MGGVKVMVDNENVRFEKRRCSCESEEKAGYKIVLNDVGVRKMGLKLMSGEPISPELVVDWVKLGATRCRLPN